MNEPGAAADAADAAGRRALAVLLRFLAAAGGEVAVAGENPVRLRTRAGREASVAAPVMADALRLGLAVRAGDTLRSSGETRAYLRRLLSGADAFRDQHRDLAQRTVDIGPGRQPVSVNRLESPLSTLARLKDKAGSPFLAETAMAAGERLARDFCRAGLQPRLTMVWQPRLSGRTVGEAGQGREISDTAIAARQRLRRAIEAMGPELSGVALDVCCFMKGLETVERERQWPVRSAKLMLRAALMALARHYDPPPVAARRQHAWGAEGYRPELAALLRGDERGPR